MATEKINRPASGSYSLDSGKYYFQVVVSQSSSGFKYDMKVVITDEFKNSHKFKVKSPYTATSNVSLKKKQTYNFGGDSIGDSQKAGAIIFYVDNKKKAEITAGTIKYKGQKPKAPGTITLNLVNDARVDITVKGSHNELSPTNKIYIERCKDVYDKNSFSGIPSSPFGISGERGSYVLSKTDQSSEIERGHRYWFRARSYNTLSNKYSAYVYSKCLYTTSTNDALSGDLTAQRISNNQVNLSWSIQNVSYVNNKLVTRFLIYRSDNEGSYKKIGEVEADAAHTQYGYQDKTCTPDNTYKYALKLDGKGTRSEDITGETELVYMTPARPQGVEAAHTSSGDVVVTVKNQSRTATQICIERSLDGGAWTQIAEEDYVEGGQTYADDTATAQDSIEYRVRNKCDQLTGTDMYSDYVTSTEVVEKSQPNPPTLKSPVSGSSMLLDQGSIRFVWQHNATDGSAQEAAQIRYKKNSGSWTTVTLTTDAYYSLSIASGYSAGDIISWQARTKGAYSEGANNGYSDWSDTATVKIVTKPVLVFTEPDNGEEISELPVELAWSYSDLSGTLKSLTVDVKKGNRLVKSFDVPVGNGATGAYSYSLAGFLFENDTVYGITATALSSSGFSSVSDIAVTIAYEEVSLDGGLIPTVSFDEDGIATIVIERDITPDPETEIVPDPIDISETYLYRLHDGERTLVASGIEEGSQVEDKYAPLNVTFSYELLMMTAGGQVSIVTTGVQQQSPFWFIYWGDSIARAKWNPTGTGSLKRPERQQVRYSGRRYAVSYDSDAIEEGYSFTAELLDREDLDAFKQMMRDGGKGIWKSGDGEVYDADFEFDYTPDLKAKQRTWKCTLAVSRIDGEL